MKNRMWRHLRIENVMKLSLCFLLRESKYIESELRSVDVQGAHEAGARPGGGGVPPTLVGRVWAP